MPDVFNESKKTSRIVCGETLNIEFPLYAGMLSYTLWIVLLAIESNPYSGTSTLSTKFIFLFIFAATFIIESFLIAYYRDFITQKIRRKPVHLAISSCGTFGCICFGVAPFLFSGPSTALAIFSAFLNGTFFAFSTVLLGEASRRRELNKLAITTVLALISLLLLVLAIKEFLEDFGVICVLCATPMVAIVSIYKAQHDNISYLKPQEFVVSKEGIKEVKEGKHWVETFDNLQISKLRFSLLLGRSAFFFGMVLGVFLFECYSFLLNINPVTSVFQILLAASSTFLFILLFFRTSRIVESGSILQDAFLALIVFLLFSYSIIFVADANVTGAPFVALLLLLGTTLWLYPASLSSRFRISAPLTYGFFASFLALGLLVSSLCYLFFLSETVPMPILLVSSTLLLVLGELSLVKEGQLKNIVSVNNKWFEDKTNQKMGSIQDGFSESGKGLFKQRCQCVADTFLLSERETQILFLLAKGRNSTYIQETLVIAEGTTRTHMRNIYAKLNVHSQQELMDIVEDFPMHHEQ